MSLLQNSNAISTGGADYNLESSLRFRSDASAYLSRTPSTTSNRKTWTLSAWVKLGKSSGQLDVGYSARSGNLQFNIWFGAAIRARAENSGGTVIGDITTVARYRDPSAWYHIVVVLDATNATTADKCRIYVNGVRQDVTTSTNFSNTDYAINTGSVEHNIGNEATQSDYFDGYMTEFNFVDGQALTPSDFGETDTTTGVWKPKRYAGTYGTNGFYLPMKETQQATGFNTVLYTGSGATNHQISNVGFSPDLVWIKDRTSTNPPYIHDSVRGASFRLNTSDTAGDLGGLLSSFDSNGFTISSSGAGVNGSSNNYVAWCWDAGSSTVSNTDGSITSSVRANPATGFSIVTYTGTGANATVGHGLGSAPDMVIVKRRDSINNWRVGHNGLTSWSYRINLESTDSEGLQSNVWNDASPTSSVFSIGTSTSVNASSGTYIAYCFSEVTGYSKFGSYTGTSGDITINCGFRPAFVMVKNTSSTGNWEIHDNTRHPSVATDTGYSARLRANDSSAEAPFNDSPINFTDTGFVLDSSVTGNSYVDYDNNGNTYIYMAFADTRDAQFNFDASGNKNNWTANNINSNASSESTYDIMNDVATLTDEDTANFATLNPLSKGANSTLSNANLNWAAAQMAGGNHQSISSIAMSSGKWYCEFTPLGSEPQGCIFGLVSNVNTTGVYPGFTSSSYGYAGFSGNKYNNASASAYGATFALGDVIGIAFDADVGTLTFYKNGVSQGTAFSSIPAGSYYFGVGNNSSLAVLQAAFNAGQRPFKYTPPTGFKKLNTYNLPDSTIKDGSQYFDVVTYTGNATLGKVINTSIDFSTNGLAWFKARSNSAVISDWNNHFIVDSLRTFSGTPYFQILNSNSTIAESADGNILRDATSTSFQKGSGTTNENNIPYVGWLWQAGATSSSNTDGTITSTVSANTDSGFSVVTYTGAGTSAGTVGHGLGVAPKVVIAKSRDGARNWAVYHSSLGINYLIELNTTSAQINIPNYWGSVSPTSEVFGVYTANNVGNNNYLNEDMVAYCFAEVEGFSKIGSYTGNGSADGTFVYFGFRPKYIMIKRTDSTGDWIVLDAARYLNNPNGTWLYPNLSNAEGVLNDIGDILSNGYKNRNTQSVVNASGGTYIYMAFAENPFKQSLAR